MKSSSRTVKGLSIAILVIAALGLAGTLFSILFLGVFGAALFDPYVQEELVYELYFDSNLTLSETQALISMMSGMTVGYMFIAFASSIVSLIAGILGTKNAEAPEKLKAVFVLAIVAAILNVLALNIVLVVLTIILAVFVNKAQKEGEAVPRFSAAPAYAQPVQPMPTQQTVPVAAPVQPMVSAQVAVPEPASGQPAVSTQAPSTPEPPAAPSVPEKPQE